MELNYAPIALFVYNRAQTIAAGFVTLPVNQSHLP